MIAATRPLPGALPVNDGGTASFAAKVYPTTPTDETPNPETERGHGTNPVTLNSVSKAGDADNPASIYIQMVHHCGPCGSGRQSAHYSLRNSQSRLTSAATAASYEDLWASTPNYFSSARGKEKWYVPAARANSVVAASLAGRGWPDCRTAVGGTGSLSVAELFGGTVTS